MTSFHSFSPSTSSTQLLLLLSATCQAQRGGWFDRGLREAVGDDVLLSGMVDVTDMTRAALQLNLRQRNLSTDGTKADLRERLLAYIQQKFEVEMSERAAAAEARAWEVELEQSGSCYAVGLNHAGQLGIGDTESRVIFTCIPELKGKNVDFVSAGADYAVAVTEDGEVFAWGGGGKLTIPDDPELLRRETGAGDERVEAVMGAFPEGVHDDRDSGALHIVGDEADWRVPQRVLSLRGEGVVEVIAGGGHVAAVSEAGDLFLWGTNHHGELAQGVVGGMAPQPLLVEQLQECPVEQVVLGESHGIAVNQRGEMYSWGLALGGRLGLGTERRAEVDPRESRFFPAPSLIPRFSGRPFVRQVACGAVHCLALVEGHQPVWTWGEGSGYRLGLGDAKSRLEPVPIEAFEGEHVLQVACGTWHSMALVHQAPLLQGGFLYSWGTGTTGQLGLGEQLQASSPHRVLGFDERALVVREVSCGARHNAALTVDRELYTWGSNMYGCLGAEVSDPFVAFPQKVWAFGLLMDGVGRGLPRSVACGRDFTVVACFSYGGPTEDEVVEAEALAGEMTAANDG